jgi:aminoglycoside phosphotransferase (APT) family kinase protein
MTGDTGIPTIEHVVERYCAATGRDGVPDLNWHFAYNLFRLTGIVQGIKKRMIDGNASSAQAAATVERLPGLAASAWGFAREAGA